MMPRGLSRCPATAGEAHPASIHQRTRRVRLQTTATSAPPAVLPTGTALRHPTPALDGPEAIGARVSSRRGGVSRHTRGHFAVDAVGESPTISWRYLSVQRNHPDPFGPSSVRSASAATSPRPPNTRDKLQGGATLYNACGAREAAPPSSRAVRGRPCLPLHRCRREPCQLHPFVRRHLVRTRAQGQSPELVLVLSVAKALAQFLEHLLKHRFRY